ncbi:hypothetical protein BD309DRAFT_1020959 [Dichomitus squalens]|uniref:Uncharacterized protein n=1 Tax=Dichomitus squalens (strain LYAD-421) TaxID=732165 RepID=R7T0B4_DICSQ|nr:uncharacterized protein DICSQDRAFT_169778 [Dichomitus squalens LYAD-421 SS1]EJF61766.1 hypothetical protein DICSQDRAFT_169778 [Dichomitus squalens LYAD-421 SS1]TBU41085.1 hypothetical protein BD309DRAFT_1020959 [Dichomitus squalens]
MATFQSADPDLSLPHPEYLRIHAACCRVAHLSGASGLFHELERDMESNPDPAAEAPQFAKTLHAKLEHLCFGRGQVVRVPAPNVQFERRVLLLDAVFSRPTASRPPPLARSSFCGFFIPPARHLFFGT